MTTAQYFKDTSLMLWKAYQSTLSGYAIATDIERWLNLGDAVLQSAKSLWRTKLSVADKQKLQAATALIKTTMQLLKGHRIGDELTEELSEKTSTSRIAITGGRVNWEDIESAFGGRIKTGIITNLKHLEFKTFMEDVKVEFMMRIKESLKEHTVLKVNTVLAAEYKIVKNDNETVDIKYFNTKASPIFSTTNLKEWFSLNVQQPLDTNMEEFQEKESGWSLRSILHLKIKINKFNPMRGSSYIKLPDYIIRKRACVNVHNNDDKCFKWAILSALHHDTHNPDRTCSYIKYESELNFSGIDFPVNVRQVGKFEKQNNISINVYFLVKDGSKFKVLPRHLTDRKQIRHVNLLIVEDYYADEKEEEEELIDCSREYKFHYVWIKDLSRLVRSQVSSHHGKGFICDRCMHFFWSNEKLTIHLTDCEKLNECKIVLPSKRDSVLQFKNFAFENKVPYVVYADFECLLQPLEINESAYQKHDAFSVGYYVKCSYDDTKSEYKSYRQRSEQDEVPAKWFVRKLQSLAFQLQKLYKNPKLMENLTQRQKFDFDRAHNCHICKKYFSGTEDKVRDHCHLTGKYRGPAHSKCNLSYRDSRVIPVIFHNLSGYDSHLFIREIALCFPGRVSLIPQTKEKYISFTKFVEGTDINLRFIDSFRFMASSLDKLASYLESHNILDRVFKHDDNFSQTQIALLKRKGIFPYDYISCFDKLEERTLPSKHDFFSSLYESHITDEEYEHAKKVWKDFNIQDLGQYSDLYLKTDVLLLAEVFENFRCNCLEAYGLDPAHYYTTPGLTWDAMLKYTQVKLDLITDIDMLMFIERGIRGGISQCCNRYAKANNKYMKEDYCPSNDDKYLMYFDVNNLYGWAMTQSLPYGGFEWVENIEEPEFYNVPEDNCYGYILEVDLEYCENLHDTHKDLPFCAEHVAPPGSTQKKLMTTLHDKQLYVLHYQALKQALSHGLRLKKIHRALRFRQSRWLKPYIDLNSERRKKAKNDFEKMLFKLFNNAVYGKTMENQRKHFNVKLVTKWNGRYGAEALIAKPNFNSCSIFHEDLVAIQLTRAEVCIKKPIYIGLSVLDLSKTLVYRFHYDYMQKSTENQCKLLYTDTDSLIYEITNVDIYDVMRRDICEFDTSDYSENNQFGLPLANKKVVGLMKDECNGDIMLEFVGLRSKMYSIRVQNRSEVKKAKGVKTSVVKATICFKDYVKCLQDKRIITREQRNIRSRLHQLYTEKEIKIALSAHDDKRFLQPGKTDTLPWGHCKIMLEEMAHIIREGRKEKEARPITASELGVGIIQPLQETMERGGMTHREEEVGVIEPPNPQGSMVGGGLYEAEQSEAEHSRSSRDNQPTSSSSSSTRKRLQLKLLNHQLLKKSRN